MNIGTLLEPVISSPAFIAIYLCVLLSAANFAIGTLRAFGNGSFDFKYVGAWIKGDGVPIGIIFVILLLGVAVGLVDTSKIPLLPKEIVSGGIITVGLVQAVTFMLAKYQSIVDSISPARAASRLAEKADKASVALDPLPTQ